MYKKNVLWHILFYCGAKNASAIGSRSYMGTDRRPDGNDRQFLFCVCLFPKHTTILDILAINLSESPVYPK